MSRLEIEGELLETISPHPRIIGLKNRSSTGLYLERAVNGTLASYLLEWDNPRLPSSNDCLGAVRLRRLLHIPTRIRCCTATSRLQISSLMSSFILSCPISKGSSYPKMEKSFWTVAVGGLADSNSLEMIESKRMSKWTSLPSDVLYTLS